MSKSVDSVGGISRDTVLAQTIGLLRERATALALAVAVCWRLTGQAVAPLCKQRRAGARVHGQPCQREQCAVTRSSVKSFCPEVQACVFPLIFVT